MAVHPGKHVSARVFGPLDVLQLRGVLLESCYPARPPICRFRLMAEEQFEGLMVRAEHKRSCQEIQSKVLAGHHNGDALPIVGAVPLLSRTQLFDEVAPCLFRPIILLLE